MNTKILKREGKGWVLTMAILVLWTIAMAYLIHHYGPAFNVALLDSTVHTVLLFGGFLFLENVFRFYLPQGSNIWLALVLPLLLGALVVYVGDFSLRYLMGNHGDYLVFLDQSLAIKGAIVFILFSVSAILLIIDGKLEDQLKTREREEMILKMSKEAELYHLRQQLQPHFLFNCLNSISALIKTKPDKAREMVLQLSDFLRKTIRKEDKKWVNIEEETAYLQLFLDIERVRFGHRLQVDFQVEEASKDLSIPPLMIQPLLENAIKHGLYGLTGEVLIRLQIKKKEKYLEVVVSNPFDSGSGEADGEGFGLEAIKRRLYLLFGRQDLLNCDSRNDVFSVTLNIPQLYDQNRSY